jgi:hypothetical protein
MTWCVINELSTETRLPSPYMYEDYILFHFLSYSSINFSYFSLHLPSLSLILLLRLFSFLYLLSLFLYLFFVIFSPSSLFYFILSFPISFIFFFCNAQNRTILLSVSEALPTVKHPTTSVHDAMRWIQASCVCLSVQWPAFFLEMEAVEYKMLTHMVFLINTVALSSVR